jgi:integrase
MGRKNTGTVRILKNANGERQWHAKYTLADGERGDWEPLDRKIPLDDKGAAQAEAARLAPKVRAASFTAGGETVEQYAKRWLDDRDGRVNSIRDDRSRMRDHVLPTLGRLEAAMFTRDDVERLRDLLDEKIVKGELAWKTVGSVWTLVTSMCADMVTAKKRELRTREDNPCRDVKPPERGDKKGKQYLWPSEFLTLISSPKVPLRWRQLFALAVYTYTRAGELEALHWEDVDLEHGSLHVHRATDRAKSKAHQKVTKSTKSGVSRRLPIEPALSPLLDRFDAQRAGRARVFAMPPHSALSLKLKLYLARAGVTRRELFITDATRKAITFHDLRATGITWCAIRGDDPMKIKQRAGHTTVSTTEIYIREAEAVRDGFGEVFPPLPEELWNIAPISPRALFLSRYSQKQAVSGGEDGIRTRV